MLYDAHLHIHEASFLNIMKKHMVTGIANAASTKEYLFLKNLQNDYPYLQISAGIHPWYVSESSWEMMINVLKDAAIIGEIGLDNVWCDSDIDLQFAVFEKQLAFASEACKPVILHLKGLEKEAITYLMRYPNTYLVHWLSEDKVLPELIDLGCYFTIGPSLTKDNIVRNIARKVPLDRILIETDGLNALTWCENRKVSDEEYSLFLKRTLYECASIRNIELNRMQQVMEQNYQCFLQGIK